MGRSSEQIAAREELKSQFVEIDDPRLTNAEIARRLGVATITVERLRRELGRRKERAAHKGFKSRLESLAVAFSEVHLQLTDFDLAKQFQVSVSTVEHWRQRLGLKKGHSGKWSRVSHPRGYLGKSHGLETRRKISEGIRLAWTRPDVRWKTEESLQKRSDASVAYQFKNRFSPRYSRAAQGARADLGGKYFRSAWEANYARYLNFLKGRGEIHRWEYEADTFWFEGIKRGCRFYTPDFKIWEKEDAEPYYVEIKGWMDQKSKTKLDRMRRYHPHIRIVLIAKYEYLSLSRFSRLIPGWEHQR